MVFKPLGFATHRRKHRRRGSGVFDAADAINDGETVRPAGQPGSGARTGSVLPSTWFTGMDSAPYQNTTGRKRPSLVRLI